MNGHAPPWKVTDTACVRYAFARRWIAAHVDYDSIGDDVLARVDSTLTALQWRANIREIGQYGRELWRGTKRLGGGLWWVIDPPPLHRPNALPRVLWVGHGVPSSSVWLPRQ